MKTKIFMILTAAFAIASMPPALAAHDAGCIPGAADPSTYVVVDLGSVGGSLYYVEERDSTTNAVAVIPATGYLFGAGSFIHEETNGVDGLQRGMFDPETCFPGPGLPCLFFFDDVYSPIDEECGHGPDGEVWSVYNGQ